MSEILALLFLIIFIYVSYKNIVHGLALIILLLPSYLWRLSFLSLPTTFLELMIVGIFFIWLLKDRKYKQINFKLKKEFFNKVSSPWHVLISLWLIASTIAWLVNPTMSALGLWRAYWLEPIMFFLVLIYSIKNKKDFYVILKALAGLILWLFIIAVWQYFSGWLLPVAYDLPNIRRLTALYSYPNALALLSAPIATFFGVWWLENKQKIKDVWKLLIFILGLLLSLAAISEGALVGIFVTLFFYLILAKKYQKIVIPAVLTVGLAFIFLGSGLDKINQFKQQIFEPNLNSLQATSLEIRSNQWTETWEMLKDNFILGSGIDGYQIIMDDYRQYDWIETYLYPHNIFLNFWVELGFLGLILFILILFYLFVLFKDLFKQKNNLAWPFLAFWITWFVHGLVDVPYFKNDLSLLFFVFLALSLLIKDEKIADLQ